MNLTVSSLLFAWLVWNPDREIFRIPYIDHPVMWYGVLFVSGFLLGYFQMVALLKTKLNDKDASQRLTDKLILYTIVGTIVGARLGHVLFYDLNYTLEHPLSLFMVWNGGLASHGGTIGVMIALFLFCRSVRKQYPQLTFMVMLDMVCVPTAIVAVFIRLGNFVNQEILGTKTSVPWAIIFGSPYDGSAPTPRHPVVLYEALSYLFCYFVVRHLWIKYHDTWKPGRIVGVFFLIVFGSRFVLEYFKADLGHLEWIPFLQMGQLLSIPFILAGTLLYLRKD
jgi:prolipoprotein diacylglyceryl transferase